MDKQEIAALIRAARNAMQSAYAPYSGFFVGAALLGKNGAVYTGCNIENASFSATNCAERTAFYKGISEGVRDFRGICIMGGRDGCPETYTPPCGVCRQVMAEFCDPETFEVILAVNEKEYQVYRLKELLPLGFGKKELGGE